MDIYEAILQPTEQKGAYALALVLETEGSTPCKPGAKALIDASGAINHGTVGGGLAEAEARRRAVAAIQQGRPIVFDFASTGGEVAGGVPICGGVMRMLVDPNPARHHAALQAAVAALQHHKRGLLLFTINTSANPSVEVQYLPEGEVSRTDAFCGAEALSATLQQEEADWFASPSPEQPLELFAEPQIPKPRLIISGGGHVGQAVAVQANMVGFHVIVVDDRPEFTRPELFPTGSDLRCGDFSTALSQLAIDDDTFIVIVTRGHQNDALVLSECLRHPTAFIGMIGSRRKVTLMRKDFIASGRATAEQFDRIYAPIGLDIGSVTVPEIAMSIVAQLIAVRRRGNAPRMPYS